MRQCLLHCKEHALEKSVAEFVEQLLGEHVHGRKLRDAGIGDENVNLAEPLCGLLEEAPNIGELTDVPLNRKHVAPQALDRLIECLTAAPEDGHLCAVG